MQQLSQTKRSAKGLLFLALLLTFGFRLLQLDVDPPADLDWSGGYFADEGYWAHNARNAVVFGMPVLDQWDARVISPIFTRIQEAIFRLLGVGLVQVRLIGVLSSLILTTATFLLLQKYYLPGFAFLGAMLVSLNFPMMVLGRQGILDPFSTMLAWLSLLFLLSDSRANLFLAGILFTAACVTKYLIIFLVFPFFFLIVSRKSLSSLVAFGSGALLGLLAWLYWNYWPNREAMEAFGTFYSSQQGSSNFFSAKNVIQQPFYLYFVKTPAVMLFGNLLAWYFVVRPRTSGVVERACWLILLTGILFFALGKYRPLRYYTPLIPPLALMAGFCLLRMEEIAEALKKSILLWFGVAAPVVQVLFVLMDRWLGWNYVPEQIGIRTLDALLFVVGSGMLILVLLRLKNKTKWAAVCFAFLFLASDIRNYLVWMIRPERAALSISRDLQHRLNQAVLTGQWAPELVLENRLRAVPVWKGFVNSDHPFEKHGITHLLLWKYPLGDENEKFREWYPEDFHKFQPIFEYRIKDSKLILYERKK